MKPFTSVALAVLAVLAILHALRLAYGWSVTVDGIDIPNWVSIAGSLIAAVLGIGLWRETRAPQESARLSITALERLLGANQRLFMGLDMLTAAFPVKGGDIEDQIVKFAAANGYNASFRERPPPAVTFERKEE